MKYLLILLVLAVLFFRWSSARKHQATMAPRPPQAPPPGAIPMHPCVLCGLNTPQTESVQGRQGWYCCEDHHQRAEP